MSHQAALRRTARLALILALALATTTACVTLPDQGPVVQVDEKGSTQPEAGVERRAPLPQENQAKQSIVNGFLQAMTAFPVRLDVARQYLASDFRAQWEPDRRIITFDSRDNPLGSRVVKIDIHGAHWVDDRGTWRGELGSGDVRLRFKMVQEDKEWRIEKAPDALIVPDTWFHDRYRTASVYYVDPTASILVPEPIYVRSDQIAASLVQALLDGPGPKLDDIVRSFVPDGLTPGLSVPVSADGEATISLEGDVPAPTPDAARLMIYQLAWTLRQDPRVSTFTVTLNDQPLTMADGGGTEFSRDLGSEYAPYDIRASSWLFSLDNGLLEFDDGQGVRPVAGPLGQVRYGVQDVAVNLQASLAATVSGQRTALALTSVSDDSHPYQEVLSAASNLLRPSWDFAGRLWIVDRTDGGAAVSLIDTARDATHAIPVEIKGITGAKVKRFLVSRDGTRLVAVVQGARGDTLRMSRLRYDALGRPRPPTASRNLPWGGGDEQRIRDIGWRSPTSVGVLHQYTRAVAQFVAVPVDGSPSLDDRLTLPGPAREVVSSPVPTETLYIRTDDELEDPTGAEGGSARQLEPTVTSVQYAG